MNWNVLKQIGATIAAFVGGYAVVMISSGHDASIAFSWSALLSGLTASGFYHAGLAQQNPWGADDPTIKPLKP